jgi:hypothetical protein
MMKNEPHWAGFIAFQEASNLLMDIMLEYSFMSASTLFYQIIVNYIKLFVIVSISEKEPLCENGSS